MGCQSLGGTGSPLRVSGPLSFTIPSLSCSAPSAKLQPQFHPRASSCRYGRSAAEEGSSRACASFPRLLQPSFCHSQGHRWVAPGDRPFVPQQLGGRLPFAHGDYPVYSPISPSGDWMVFLDLQDAYLQVPVHPSSRRYLRFCVGESVFQFRALCFGLSTALQTFTLVMALVSSIMHCRGFRILRYLDDWLVLGSSYQEIVRARDFLLWLCHQLGIQVNIPKSFLTPTQSLDYLGMMIRTVPLRVFPTLKRVQKLSSLLKSFLSDNLHPLSVWRQLLGVMSSVSALVPGARLLQLWLNVAGPSLLEDSGLMGRLLPAGYLVVV